MRQASTAALPSAAACLSPLCARSLAARQGSLLKRLQSEEASTSQLSAIIKRYKSEHKKLLAKIANPRWEIAHHYHMTCIEHQLGSARTHAATQQHNTDAHRAARTYTHRGASALAQEQAHTRRARAQS